MNSHPPILVVVGPTSSGKSDLAETLALERGGEILNADSQQFYRGFDIGTGKAPMSNRKIPHHLLDLCAPGEFITAGEFALKADAMVAELRETGRVPIVVGGTGLYLRSLLEGLDPLPPRDEALRRALGAILAEKGAEELHRQLERIDPVSAAKIHPRDPARLVRYLEIYHASGKPPSQLMKGRRPERLRYAAQTYWLCPPRDRLRPAIARRVREMFERGWVEEVQALLKRGIEPRSLPNKPIGYGEIAEALRHGGRLEKTMETIILRTQQYAKRQDTFFKGLLAHSAYRENGSTLEVIAG
jgi:tRNA dimethylallyltransferase